MEFFVPKLLIVDDEADIREFARRFFAKRNIDVFTASGGREALETIEREMPDLVLLDVRMEGITGVEVLRELRGRHNAVKVIMVSGIEDETIVEDARKYGVRDFIHKPLVLEELERIVLAELKK